MWIYTVETWMEAAKPGAIGKPFELTAVGGMMATHISVSTLVQMSYSKKPFLYGLPAWAENEERAIVATTPGWARRHSILPSSTTTSACACKACQPLVLHELAPPEARTARLRSRHR